MELLDKAKKTVENMVELGKIGPGPFTACSFADWQYNSLLTLGARKEAEELAAWWMNHPAHPANAK